MPELDTFFQQSFNGLVISGIYVLVALGITLAFGLTGIANFSHGQFMLLGGFFAYAAVEWGFPLTAGLAVAVVGVALVSYAAERGVFQFTLSNPTSGFVASLGMGIGLESLIVKIWGLEDTALSPWVRGVWSIGDVHFAKQRVIVLGLAAVMVLGLFALLKYTNLGRAMRACAEDRDTAQLMGANVGGTIGAAFVIGGALAGAAGMLLGTLFPFTPFTGGKFILKGFAIAMIGGLGSVPGAVAGALLLGMGETYWAAYVDPAYTEAIAFVIMIAVISLRPSGIFKSHTGHGF